MCPPPATKAAASVRTDKAKDAEADAFLRAFAVLLSCFTLARWVSPPVPLPAIAWQSAPVLAALVLPCAWRRAPMRAVLGLFLVSNVLLVYMHLPAVVDKVRARSHGASPSRAGAPADAPAARRDRTAG